MQTVVSQGWLLTSGSKFEVFYLLASDLNQATASTPSSSASCADRAAHDEERLLLDSIS